MSESKPFALDGSNIACNLCAKHIEKKYERVVIERRKEFDVVSEIESLPFHVVRTSRYVCRSCVQQSKKRPSHIIGIDSIEKYFRN